MQVKNNQSKVKKDFLLLDILAKIDKRETPYDIQKTYGWSKQRLNYYLVILKKNNNLIKTTQDFLEETDEEGD